MLSNAASILLLSNDEELRAAIRGLLPDRHALVEADTPHAAVWLAAEDTLRVVIVDSAAVHGKLVDFLSHLSARDPAPVTIVIGGRDQGSEFLDLVDSGEVFRFLLKPVSFGQARLYLEAASRQALELTTRPAPAAEPSPLAGRAWPFYGGGGLAMLALLVAWIASSDDPHEAPAAPARRIAAAPVADMPRAPRGAVSADVTAPHKTDPEPAAGILDTHKTTAEGAGILDTHKTVEGPVTLAGGTQGQASGIMDTHKVADGLGDAAGAMGEGESRDTLKFPEATAATLDTQNSPVGAAGASGESVIGDRSPDEAGLARTTEEGPGIIDGIMDTHGAGPVGVAGASGKGVIGDKSPDEARIKAQVERLPIEDLRDASLAQLPGPGDDAGQTGTPSPHRAAGADEIRDTQQSPPEVIAGTGQSSGPSPGEILAIHQVSGDIQDTHLASGEFRETRRTGATPNYDMPDTRPSSVTQGAGSADRPLAGPMIASSSAAQSIPSLPEDGAEQAFDRETALARLQRVGIVGGELVVLARARLATNRLLEPEDDSALFYVEAARAAQVDPAAVAGISAELGDRLIALAVNAHRAGETDTAQDLLARGTALGATEMTLLAARATIELARVREVETRTRLASLAGERIESGQLIEPDDDSARHYLNELGIMDPEAGVLKEVAARYNAHVLNEASAALEARAFDKARDWLDAMHLATGAVARKASLARDIDRAERASMIEAAGAVRRHYVPPRYPRIAQRRGVEGNVIVSFTLGVDGSVREAIVVDARPSGTFDDAALEAVRQWRYEPVVVAGEPVEKPLQVNLVFALEE